MIHKEKNITVCFDNMTHQGVFRLQERYANVNEINKETFVD